MLITRPRSRGSGCPVHKKQLLPVLVVWAPPRKKRNQEHALKGNTSASESQDAHEPAETCDARYPRQGGCPP